ncbi:MAG: hypothetical protein DME25_02635 [Verrucomicrobia bacterium]|nr:MAG: hypothetical protein DME25_02635 [Verrucomicrobiota bacterium]
MAKAIPDGFHTITPHLIVQDAARAIEFYKKAFGAQEEVRHMMPDGKAVMHAQLKIGNSMVMIANEFPPTCLSPKSRGGTSVSLHIYVENADATFDRAVKAGCSVKMPMSDMFWGDRYGQVEDPSGRTKRTSPINRLPRALGLRLRRWNLTQPRQRRGEGCRNGAGDFAPQNAGQAAGRSLVRRRAEAFPDISRSVAQILICCVAEWCKRVSLAS